MADPKDLQDILPSDLFNHPDCFNSKTFRLWEYEIATPALEAQGFLVGPWYSAEEDSFGPLIRETKLTKNGTTEIYFYG